MNASYKKRSQSRNDATLNAGVGKVDITAKAGELSYALYPKKTMAHIPPQYRDQRVEINDPLYARALVLDGGDEKVVMVTMDCCAIAARTTSQYILYDSPDDFMPRLRRRVEKEFGIAGERVSVSASHTHPPGRLLCDDDEQVNRTIAAIKQALDSMVPVTVGVGAGCEKTLTINRGNYVSLMKYDTDLSRRPTSPADKGERLLPIDPEIGILRIDRLDGSPLAVVYDFASHLLVGCRRGKITADFPGVASAYLEEQIGGGVMAVFLQGANGDIMERSYFDKENPPSMHDFGRHLGESVLKTYRTIQTVPAPVAVTTRHVEFPLRQDIPEAVAAYKREQAELVASLRYVRLKFREFLPLYLKYALRPDYPNHLIPRYLQAEAVGDDSLRELDRQNRTAIDAYLEGIRAMETMAVNEMWISTLEKHGEIIAELGGKTVPAEIKAIRIGDAVFIAAPMEVLSTVGFKVKKLSPFKYTYIISNANGYLHYSPPASYYGRGFYEAIECLLAPEWEAIFLKTIKQLFTQL